MNKIKLGLITIVVLLFCACERNKYKVTSDGLQYKIIEDFEGATAKIGNILQLDLTYSTSSDSILYDSKILGDSFLIELTKPTFVGGIESGFVLLSEGDSAEFLVSADSVYSKLFHNNTPEICKEKTLKFNLRLKKIIDKKSFIEQQKLSQKKADNNKGLLIQKFLDENNIQASPIAKGVYLFPIEKVNDNAQSISIGDQVVVSFVGKTLEGQIFVSNKLVKGDFIVKVGSNENPPIFNVALQNMKIGTFYRLILDDIKLYDMFGKDKIDQPSPVVYDLKVIKKVKVN